MVDTRGSTRSCGESSKGGGAATDGQRDDWIFPALAEDGDDALYRARRIGSLGGDAKQPDRNGPRGVGLAVRESFAGVILGVDGVVRGAHARNWWEAVVEGADLHFALDPLADWYRPQGDLSRRGEIAGRWGYAEDDFDGRVGGVVRSELHPSDNCNTRRPAYPVVQA